MKRFLIVVMVVATFLATMALPALADDDDIEDAIDDGDAGVRLLTRETAAVTRGDDVWVMLNWTSFGRVIDGVDDFQVRLRKKPPKDVEVAYPVNTGDHTSLWDDDALAVGEVDYTALNVVVSGDYKKDTIKLKLEATYTVDGERFEQRFDLEIPVVSFEGDPVEQVTHDWGTATAGEAAWFEIAYAGQAPSVTEFEVVISGPGGVAVTYPQGDYTSLHFDDVLESRETDVVRVYLETAGLESGDHVFDVKCVYSYNGERVSEEDTVTLEITAP